MTIPHDRSSVDEIDRIRAEYDRRDAAAVLAYRYSPLHPSVYHACQYRQRLFIHFINRFLAVPLGDASIVEIGCGTGSNLRELIQLGASPHNLTGIDLMPDRIATARRLVASQVKLLAGNALDLCLPLASFDIVCQSTVFSSLLTDSIQSELAARMWSFVKPGGAVLWYDFTFNNPSNRHVRGVPLRRVRELFPEGEMHFRTTTLAPPISRCVVRIHSCMYHVLHFLPLLRTHLVCWIRKPFS